MSSRLEQRSRVDHRLLVIFMVLVVCLGLFGWKIQSQQAEYARDQYEACRVRQENVRRLNAQSAAFAEIERKNPYRFTSPETIEARIKIYEAAHLDVPLCFAP